MHGSAVFHFRARLAISSQPRSTQRWLTLAANLPLCFAFALQLAPGPREECFTGGYRLTFLSCLTRQRAASEALPVALSSRADKECRGSNGIFQ
jgi:hypothetical protein